MTRDDRNFQPRALRHSDAMAEGGRNAPTVFPGTLISSAFAEDVPELTHVTTPEPVVHLVGQLRSSYRSARRGNSDFDQYHGTDSCRSGARTPRQSPRSPSHCLTGDWGTRSSIAGRSCEPEHLDAVSRIIFVEAPYHYSLQQVRESFCVTVVGSASSNPRGRMSSAAPGASLEARDNGKPAERLGRKAPRLKRGRAMPVEPPNGLHWETHPDA
jgi:hypothetical protein